MKETVPLLSPLLPPQLILMMARRLGFGRQALNFIITKIASKDRKPKVFAGYEPAAHDVFVTCFSKSGTNWALQLTEQIAHRGEAEFRHIHDVAPWPDGDFPGIIPLDDPGPRNRAPTGLRSIKTALEAEYVPYDPRAKYLCIARDPKEISVSAYHFLTGIFGLREHISPQQWYEMDLQPDSILGTWPDHMAGYWAWRDRPNVLVLIYPEMKNDLPGTVDKVAGLLDVELDEQQRAEVIRKCGFTYMKSRESCFAPPRLPLLTGKNRGKMMRSGKSGKSSEFLSNEQRGELDARMLARLKELGSDFPYEELFMASPA